MLKFSDYMSLLFVGVVIIALLVMPSNIANPYRKIDFETVTKSVVMVIPRQKEYSEGGSMGTGFLIGDNLFMTNAHVVNSILQKTPLSVIPKDKLKLYDAVIVNIDTLSDIALFKLTDKAWAEFKSEVTDKTLPFATEKPTLGENVYTIGHPEGNTWTVARGIISRLMVNNFTESNQGQMYYTQTDANIFRGNSGGPMLNEHGEVIGMNSMMKQMTGGSLGFAIPSEVLKRISGDLLKYGHVKWAAFGIGLSWNDKGETVIKKVFPDAPASGKLQENDIIVSMSDVNRNEKIEYFEEVLHFVLFNHPGETVTFTVLRNGKLINVPVVTAEKLSIEYIPPGQ